MKYEFVVPVWLQTRADDLERSIRSIRDNYSDSRVVVYADGAVNLDVERVAKHDADYYIQFNRVKHLNGALWYYRIFNLFSLGEYDRHIKIDPDVSIIRAIELDRGDVAGRLINTKYAREGVRGALVSFSPSAVRYIIRSNLLLSDLYQSLHYKRMDKSDEYYTDGILADVLRRLPFLSVVDIPEIDNAIIH